MSHLADYDVLLIWVLHRLVRRTIKLAWVTKRRADRPRGWR